MKRFAAVWTVFMILLLFVGCSASSPEVIVNGEVLQFVGSRTEGTIVHDGNNYAYQTSEYQIFITYPHGAEYVLTMYDNGSSGGWRNPLGEEFVLPAELGYLDEDILIDAIQSRQPRRLPASQIAISVILVLLGLWGVLSPYTQWYASYGWRYKDAEPSDAALLIGRITSGVILLAGIAVLFAPGLLGL